MYCSIFISKIGTGAVVYCVVSIGMAQVDCIDISRTGTRAVMDCDVSSRLILGH